MDYNGQAYTKIRVIGKGSFGQAVLVRNTKDLQTYVIKEINVSHLSKKAQVEALNEVKILSALQHPSVVTYVESFIDQKRICIVMEFASGGDLSDKIRRQAEKLIREDIILDWFVQICLGLKHCHDRKILHRDLKTQNIFLTSDNKIKLGDFGIARAMESTMQCAQTYVGTPYYMSPEICQDLPYNNKSDIWSLGCILYELATLKHPFEGRDMKGLVREICRGIYTPVSRVYSTDLRSMIAWMLNLRPEKRPTVNDLLSLPVLKCRIHRFLGDELIDDEFSHTILHNVNPFEEVENHDATILRKCIARADAPVSRAPLPVMSAPRKVERIAVPQQQAGNDDTVIHAPAPLRTPITPTPALKAPTPSKPIQTPMSSGTPMQELKKIVPDGALKQLNAIWEMERLREKRAIPQPILIGRPSSGILGKIPPPYVPSRDAVVVAVSRPDVKPTPLRPSTPVSLIAPKPTRPSSAVLQAPRPYYHAPLMTPRKLVPERVVVPARPVSAARLRLVV